MEEVQLLLQLALDAAGMATWDASIVDGDITKGMVTWSSQGAALVGLPLGEQQQSFPEFLALLHPDDRDFLREHMQAMVDKCLAYQFSYRVILQNGHVRWVAARGQAICENGVPVRTLGIVWNDTQRREQELQLFEQKELAEVTLGSIHDGVITVDASAKVRFLNHFAQRLTGWSQPGAVGQCATQIVHMFEELSGKPVDFVGQCLGSGHSLTIDSTIKLRTADGRHIDIEGSVAPIWSANGEVLGAVLVFRDVSHERMLTQQLSWEAAHDPLTGLINRREFENRMMGVLRDARDDRHEHVLMFIDLDRFKIVNDTCGHGAGDRLLQLLTKTLQDHMRDSDVLARLGGDEFGALLQGCSVQHAMVRAEEMRHAIKSFRFVWEGQSFELGVSIGLAAIDATSSSISELLSNADEACYMAKEQGRNRIHVYRESDTITTRRQSEVRWVPRLNEALALNHFALFAQPIVHLGNGGLSHQEVLIRLRDEEEGCVLPSMFIPAAERYDLMPSIDRWVIERVCRHIHLQRAAHDPPGDALPDMYSVNLSGRSLNDDDLFRHIVAQFERFQIAPQRICFEITETAVISNLSKALEFMSRLRTLGCRFSLDDFGSGFSSFAYLRTLPVEFLKIDGAFVRGIAKDAINRELVRVINDIGHVMGIQTVAEYVEDKETLDLVHDLGIDYAQGYAVGTPRELAYD